MVENIITVSDSIEDIQDDLTFIKYVYQNKTRCRFNIYGLKNSDILKNYLIDEFSDNEGINNIAPSTITGNVLIEFSPQKTNHKKIFEKLQALVNPFIKNYSFPAVKKRDVAPLSLNKLDFQTYPQSKQCNRDCASCSDACFDKTIKSINIDRLLSITLKTAGSLLLQRIAKKFIRQSLCKIIF